MSAGEPQDPDASGVTVVRELERRLAERDYAQADAAARVSSAREHAGRVLAEARERAQRHARERRVKELADAERSEAILLLRAREEVERLRQQVSSERDRVIETFLQAVLPEHVRRGRGTRP